jgi:23S rRNA (adenine2503-C2)-methyltransferase
VNRDPHNILGLTSGQVSLEVAVHGIRTSEALALYRRAFRIGWLDDDGPLQTGEIVNVLNDDGAIKFIQRYNDGLETESVILPYISTAGRPRNTLCVSSQVGCAMGCTFCETAQMGLMKNLTAAQIVGQWHAARFGLGAIIDNIVFMGMGEPTDNLDNVIQAIRVFADRNGPAIAPARISVSTVGRVSGILRLAALARIEGFHKLRLAVSINAPNDEIRSRLMPINRSTPMAKLMEAMLAWPTNSGGRRQRILIEYVLIPGVNDAPEHAEQLCRYLKPLTCTVNVIPYNPRRNSPWPAPSEQRVREFVEWVHQRGQFVKRRQTIGRSLMAACGQLGNPTIRGRKIVAV